MLLQRIKFKLIKLKGKQTYSNTFTEITWENTQWARIGKKNF